MKTLDMPTLSFLSTSQIFVFLLREGVWWSVQTPASKSKKSRESQKKNVLVIK